MYYVYVVELAVAVRSLEKWIRENPRRGKACLYVGATGLTPRERFANHKIGYKACRLVRRFGHRLRPALAPRKAFATWDEAAEAEVRLANRLRRQGYEVWQR